mmetsp:Transcript_132/g.272  ORF Transcript_132/g.272 Transcript_132/m.272 type:complete len:308 (-) Transcript_132:501-1424(-)
MGTMALVTMAEHSASASSAWQSCSARMMRSCADMSRPVRTMPAIWPSLDHLRWLKMSMVRNCACVAPSSSAAARRRASFSCVSADFPPDPGCLKRSSMGLGSIPSHTALRIATSMMFAELGSRKLITLRPTEQRLAPASSRDALVLCSVTIISALTLITGRSAVPMMVRNSSATLVSSASVRSRPLSLSSAMRMRLDNGPCWHMPMASRTSSCMAPALLISCGSHGWDWHRTTSLTAAKLARGSISNPRCRAWGARFSPAHASSLSISPRNQRISAGYMDMSGGSGTPSAPAAEPSAPAAASVGAPL